MHDHAVKFRMQVLSKRVFLLLLLLFQNQDPLYFSVQSGKPRLPDPGVNVSLFLDLVQSSCGLFCFGVYCLMFRWTISTIQTPLGRYSR